MRTKEPVFTTNLSLAGKYSVVSCGNTYKTVLRLCILSQHIAWHSFVFTSFHVQKSLPANPSGFNWTCSEVPTLVYVSSRVINNAYSSSGWSKQINAAFIDYAPNKKGYLPIRTDYVPLITNRRYDGRILAGDEIIVQLEKEAVRTKDLAYKVLQNPSFHCKSAGRPQ